MWTTTRFESGHIQSWASVECVRTAHQHDTSDVSSPMPRTTQKAATEAMQTAAGGLTAHAEIPYQNDRVAIVPSFLDAIVSNSGLSQCNSFELVAILPNWLQ